MCMMQNHADSNIDDIWPHIKQFNVPHYPGLSKVQLRRPVPVHTIYNVHKGCIPASYLCNWDMNTAYKCNAMDSRDI